MSIKAVLLALIVATQAEMITVRGHVICLLEERGAATAAHEHDWGFGTTAGRRYPLVRVVTSEALFVDPQLRERDLEITGQVHPNGRLEVIQTRSVRNGRLHDVYYWCETCHIRALAPGPCWCCFQPFEFKEVAR